MITLGNFINSSFKDYLMLTDFPNISRNNAQHLEKSGFSYESPTYFYFLLLEVLLANYMTSTTDFNFFEVLEKAIDFACMPCFNIAGRSKTSYI
jgi:hypothetical protein